MLAQPGRFYFLALGKNTHADCRGKAGPQEGVCVRGAKRENIYIAGGEALWLELVIYKSRRSPQTFQRPHDAAVSTLTGQGEGATSIEAGVGCGGSAFHGNRATRGRASRLHPMECGAISRDSGQLLSWTPAGLLQCRHICL